MFSEFLSYNSLVVPFPLAHRLQRYEGQYMPYALLIILKMDNRTGPDSSFFRAMNIIDSIRFLIWEAIENIDNRKNKKKIAAPNYIVSLDLRMPNRKITASSIIWYHLLKLSDWFIHKLLNLLKLQLLNNFS